MEERLCGCFIDPPVKLFSSVLPDRENTGKPSYVYKIGDIHKALSTLLKKEGTETSRTASKEDEEKINNARRDIEAEYQESLSSHRFEKVSLEKGYESINETFPFSEANEPLEIKLEQIISLSDSSDNKIPHVIQDAVCDEEDDARPDDEENRTESLDPEAWVEGGYGSGFIVGPPLVGNNLIITCKHVVAGAKKILISNAVIRELPCNVVKEDPNNDLALLYCEKLDVEKSEICPLQLSEREPLQGMPIFTLGYPISHTGKAAVFLKGYVAGELERYGREPLLIFNIPLNNGNSGGPIFWRCEKDKLNVVAVVKEKHLKRVSSCYEASFIEHVRSMLTKLESTPSPNFSTANNGLDKKVLELTLSLLPKFLDSQERNEQRYLANAIRGRFVIDLISDYKKKG